KHVLHVLGKESLVSDLNKYIACTYDPGILVSVLSVQDKQVQPQRSVRDERRDHGYRPEIWRWKYLIDIASKLQDLRANLFRGGGDEATLISYVTLDELNQLGDITFGAE